MVLTDDIDAIYRRAREAQPEWAALPVKERLRTVRRLRHAIAASADNLAEAVDATHPRGPGETFAAEVLPLAEACRHLERRACRLLKPRCVRNRLLPLWLMGVDVEVRREPFGVILVIAPSNYPLLLPGAQMAQALAAGNAVIVKPGRTGREPMRRLIALAVEAGVAGELIALLDESADSGKAAIAAGPDKVVLTGGVPTGRAVMASLAESVTPSVMELSGCDAVFVMPGADIDLAARSVAWGLRVNGGATCIAPHRVFAWRGVAGAFRERLLEAIETIEPCPVDPPVAGRIAEALAEAEGAGARRLAGSVDEERATIRPVVLEDISPEMAIVKTDLFAPVVSLMTVDDAEQALRLDEHCPFSLGASVYGPEREARELARCVDAGCVTVNDTIAATAHPAVAFGGRRASGFGVTRGDEGLLEMTAIKTIATKRGRFRPQLDPPTEKTAGFLRNYIQAAHARGLAQRIKALMQMKR
jgi:acyl-CoA reductase-like NAD-dependent aldehyde dehydrogenase